jgi:hypothetical protein
MGGALLAVKQTIARLLLGAHARTNRPNSVMEQIVGGCRRGLRQADQIGLGTSAGWL